MVQKQLSFLASLLPLIMVNPQLTPVTSGGVLTSEIKGRQATFDVTAEFPLNAVIPAMTVPSPLIPGDPTHYAVVRSVIGEDQQGDLATAMVTGFPSPQANRANHYRFVSLSSGDFMCGVSATDLFKGGWGFRGAFLNSSNGGLVGRGLLKGEYCPSFNKQGSVVDWIMEVNGSKVSIYVLRDGHPCGPAFILDFTGHEAMINTLRPAVTFGEASMDVAVVAFQPSNPSAAYQERSEAEVDPRNPLLGKWAGNLREWQGLTFPEDLVIDISPRGIHARVMNSMNYPAQFNPDGTINHTGPGASTLMMPLPPFDQAERAVNQFLQEVSRYSLNGATLSLTSNQGVRTFTRYTPRADPVLENPLLDV